MKNNQTDICAVVCSRSRYTGIRVCCL